MLYIGVGRATVNGRNGNGGGNGNGNGNGKGSSDEMEKGSQMNKHDR